MKATLPLSMSLMRAGPLGLTAVLLVWTWLVSPYSQYGDDWAVYPALVLYLAIVVWHLGLIVTQRPRGAFVLYAVTHVVLLTPVWYICLMKISKDAL
jgi:hypothetical protein